MNATILDRLDSMQAWVHRRRWWIRLATAAVVVPFAWSFVAIRWNARPPRPLSATVNALGIDLGLTRPPPDVDNTDAVVQALKALPPGPALAPPTTAPAGSRWVASGPGTPFFYEAEALAGEWTPDKRHHLREIIKYLELPAMQAALDSLVREAGRPHCLTGVSGAVSPLAEIRQATQLLAARARYHLAEHGDFDAAVRSIEAVFHLSDSMMDDGTLIRYLVALGCRSPAVQELCHWPEEFSLSAPELERLAGLLAKHPLDARSAWRQAMGGETRCSEALLDAMYVTTSDGDGFLVLAPESSSTPGPGIAGVLNLMSPLFESRRTAQRLTVLSDEQVGRLAASPVSELAKQENLPRCPSYRPVLGPTWESVGMSVGGFESWAPRTLVMGIRVQMESDLCIMTLSLRRYRIDHGRYPESLSLLVPKSVPETPVDLADGQPLRYRLDESGDYLLYSVGEDQQDDGGRRFDGGDDKPFDWVVQRRRNESTNEWFLVTEEHSGGSPGEHGTE